MNNRSFGVSALLGVLGLFVLAACRGGAGDTPAALPAPAGLTAAWAESYPPGLACSWTRVAGQVNAYHLQFRSVNGTWQDSGTTQNDLTLLTFQGMSGVPQEITDYQVRICSLGVDMVTQSAWSAPVTAHFGLFGPTITQYQVTDTGGQVAWTSNTSQADTLLAERGVSLDNGLTFAWSPLPGVVFGDTSLVDPGIPELATISYRITYSKGAEQGASVTICPSPAPLRAPSGLVAVPLVNGVSLSWSDPVTVASEIVVTRCPGNDPDGYGRYQDLAQLPAGTTSYDDLQLPTGFYSYRIDSRMPGNYGSASLSCGVATLPVDGTWNLTPQMLTLPDFTAAILDPGGAWWLATGPGVTLPPTLSIQAGTDWTAHSLPGGLVLMDPTLRLDYLGLPHAVYLRTSIPASAGQDIVHVWFDGSVWQEETVATRAFIPWGLDSDSLPDCVHFTLGGAGQLHLAWSTTGASGQGFEYATKAADGSWLIEALGVVSPAVANMEAFDLQLDGSGLPWVVHGGAGAFLLRRQGPALWTWEPVPDVSVLGSLPLLLQLLPLSGGGVDVLYTRMHSPWLPDETSDLCMMSRTPSGWSSPQLLATLPPTLDTPLPKAARSADGTATVVWTPTAQNSILLTNGPMGWAAQVLGPAPLFDTVLSVTPDLGFDPAGHPWVLQKTINPVNYNGWYDSFFSVAP